MDTKPVFPFHTIVRVRSKRPAILEIDGRLGYVAGITETPDDKGHFGYGIRIYDLGRVWCCDEDELESTGELDLDAVKLAEVQARRLKKF
jgi:hypothetical protein